MVGSANAVKVRVTVHNAQGADPAYLTRVEVALPTPLLRVPPACQEKPSNISVALVICDVANPLQPGIQVSSVFFLRKVGQLTI